MNSKKKIELLVKKIDESNKRITQLESLLVDNESVLFKKTSLANALKEYEEYMILKGNAANTISKFKTIKKKLLIHFFCDSDVNVLDDDTKVMLFFSEIKKSAPNSLRSYKKSLNPFITFCIKKNIFLEIHYHTFNL